MATLIPLSAVSLPLIEQLLDRVFGPERRALTAYRIREGTRWLEALSFAALDEEEMLVASIQVSPVALTDPEGRPHPLLMVGPVGVLPEKRGEGYGKALMLAMLEAVDAQETPLPQVLIGDADYYEENFGFTAAHTHRWRCPGPYDPKRLLVRTAHPQVLPQEGMLGPWTSETQARLEELVQS